MIEKYSSTITEITELGGASNSVSSSTLVCDRGGFAYPREKLTMVDSLELCDMCIDEDQEV